MKKAEIPRDRLSTALCMENHIGEVREKKINSIVKLPVAKTISPSESMNICDVSTRWLESSGTRIKESTYSCYLTLNSKTHSYLF